MATTRKQPTKALLLALGLVGAGTPLGGACSSAMQPVERGYEPGESRSAPPGLVAEVAWMRYEEEHVTVRTELRNVGEGAITVARSGILLAYDGLEYPPDPERSELGVVELESGEVAAVEVCFRLSRAMRDRGTLWLRSIRRADGHWLDPIALPLLPAPTPPTPEDPRPGP